MTPSHISLTPADLCYLLFGSHEARSSYMDEASFHWLRRAGAPAMDLPSKIVFPHIAKAIQQADPNEIFTHIQTVVVTPSFTYYVLWLKDHWLNSDERRLQRFFDMQSVRRTHDARTSHLDRLGRIANTLHKLTAFPLRNAETLVQGAWHKSNSEEDFAKQINHLESLLQLEPNTLYVKPHQETPAEGPAQPATGITSNHTESDSVEQSQAGKGGKEESREVGEAGAAQAAVA